MGIIWLQRHWNQSLCRMSMRWSSDSLFFLPRPPPSSAHPSSFPSYSSSLRSRHHTRGKECNNYTLGYHRKPKISGKSHLLGRHIVPSHLHSERQNASINVNTMDFVFSCLFQSPDTVGKPFTQYGRENIFF